MSEQRTVEKQVLIVEIVYDRYPNQPIYVENLEDLHQIMDAIFIDDPDKFKGSPDYNFEEWMNEGESVVMKMKFVSRSFVDKLEQFESF